MRGIALSCNALYTSIIKFFQGEALIMGCVYRATCNTNGKQYIGMTSGKLNRRRCQHLRSEDTCVFHRALRKYGKTDFEWDVLYTSDNVDSLYSKERLYIKLFNTQVPYGYNVASGGIGAVGIPGHMRDNSHLLINAKKKSIPIYCAELDEKYGSFREASKKTGVAMQTIRKSCDDMTRKVLKYHFCIGNPLCIEQARNMLNNGLLSYGRPLSEESHARLSKAQSNKIISQETRAKLSIANKGRICPPRTPIEIENIKKGIANNIENKLGAKNSRARKIVNIDTGVVYGAISEAVRALSLPKAAPSTIVLACQNPKRTAYGYRWAYYNEGKDLQRS